MGVVGDEVVRYTWTQTGIDALRNHGRLEEYGNPQTGHQLAPLHLQVLQDTGKLKAMTTANYFVETREIQIKPEAVLLRGIARSGKDCCADWEPPCMMCQSCSIWLDIA